MAEGNVCNVPVHTNDWDCSVIEMMGISKVKINPIELIKNEWSLCTLSDNEIARIEEMVEELSLDCLDFETLEDIPFNGIRCKKWISRFFGTRDEEIPELKCFKSRCEEIGYTMFSILQDWNTTRGNIAGPCHTDFQILLEKFLHLFDIKTRAQPFIKEQCATVFGQSVSTKADIVCTRSDDPGKILAVCKVRCAMKENDKNDNNYSPPQKRFRSSSAPTSKSKTAENVSCSSSVNLPLDIYAKHVGELLVYLKKFVVQKGLLGMIIEKTNVMFTFLRVSEEIRKRIPQESRSFKFDEDDEKPRFYYTPSLNYLKKEDREVLCRALVTLKMMELKLNKLEQ